MRQHNKAFLICQVHGCDQNSNTSYICKGMCRKHYTRFQRFGHTDPSAAGPKVKFDKLVPIGENIHGRRQQLKLTMQELASRSGVAAFTIIRLCDGVHESRLSTISAIAAALQCDAWQLVRPGTFLLDRNNAVD